MALAPIAQALKAQLLQARVLHADESPITILARKGEKKRGYIWAYATGTHEAVSAVVYQIKEGRSGRHARDLMQYEPPMRLVEFAASYPPQGKRLRGHLVVDDYAGYKALFVPGADATHDDPDGAPIIEVGCWAHVRRKFFELHVAAKSSLAEVALAHIAAFYAIERAIHDDGLGLGHYEGWGWRGFHHHASMSIAAYDFLMAQRLRAGSDAGGKKTSSNAKYLPFPRITSLGAVQRAQCHVADWITTLRLQLGVALASVLGHCPQCNSINLRLNL